MLRDDQSPEQVALIADSIRRQAVQLICSIVGLVKPMIALNDSHEPLLLLLLCQPDVARALQLPHRNDSPSSDSYFVACQPSDVYKLLQDTLFELLALERNPPLLGRFRQTHATLLYALSYLAFVESDSPAAANSLQTLGEIVTMISLHLYLPDLTIVQVAVDCLNIFAQTSLIISSMEKVGSCQNLQLHETLE